MPTYKVRLEYDGTAYAGWQRQPDRPTIQQALEDALRQITHSRISTVAAGRTDAGVHALGQIASFRSDAPFSPHEWTRALNGVLPKDISLLDAKVAADHFHARYDARSKTYEYRILNQPTRPALDRRRAWQIAHHLDVRLMREAFRYVLGKRDCTSFQGSPTGTHNPVCHVQRIDLVQEGRLIRFTIQADRFLKQMVRAFVGTLVEIGRGKRSPDDVAAILAAKDRRAAGPTAPPQGLYLLHVTYEEDAPSREERTIIPSRRRVVQGTVPEPRRA